MKLKCIMKTCGKEIEGEGKRCVCVCGNWMLPVVERVHTSKKVKQPVQEVDTNE